MESGRATARLGRTSVLDGSLKDLALCARYRANEPRTRCDPG